MRFVAGVILCMCLLVGSGCGTYTGIPSHGGGKRFAVEQELVAASARMAAKSVDVSPLAGKKCALYVISMGDEGSGNIVGGRYTWESAIRGEWVNTATTRTDNSFPVVPTVTTTTTGGVATVTNAENALNYPSRSDSSQKGTNERYGGGMSYNGPGEYRSDAFINPKDSEFLSAALNVAFTLKGVIIVPPQQADVDIYVLVDDFGTNRSRLDYQVYNRESLVAKTALEVTAFDRNRKLLLAPRSVAFEAEYRENTIFWMGPFKKEEMVRAASALPVDFSSLVPISAGGTGPNAGPPPVPQATDPGKTRPNDLTQPKTSPDPSRPEDQPKPKDDKPKDQQPPK